jgi:hypothetical protein
VSLVVVTASSVEERATDMAGNISRCTEASTGERHLNELGTMNGPFSETITGCWRCRAASKNQAREH